MKHTYMLSKLKIQFLFLLLSPVCLAQIPLLNSMPSITNKVIYLDFDGQVVSGTAWNSGNTVNALPSTMSANNISIIWKRISEDYRPFDVNVTTDSTRFNNAPANKRIRVVITPTSAWYGSAGGVAYVGSFTWGGTPGTPCWVFENQLGYNSKSIAEAASHEVGHTMTLRHHSIYNAACTKTAEYNPGIGTGVVSWAPIMGVGYSRNVTIWHFGPNSTGCNNIQYDHSSNNVGITKSGYLSFLTDDVGNNFSNSKILNLNAVNLVDSGVITEPTDLDAYSFTICNNRYVSVSVKPWALDTNNYPGANLDVRLFLHDAATNSVLAVDTNLTRLHARVGMNLTPGTYYFTVDGGRANNYSDYGSLGKYYISIKATNPPSMSNTIVTASNLCAGQNTSLNYSSNGVPTQWQWTVAGPSTASYTTQNPNLSFSAGMYTITLVASNSSSPSCLTTKTVNVGPTPSFSLTNLSNVLCPGKTLTLSVAGASSYTWLPGNFSGTSQIVNPSTNTSYTIIGSNGTCSNSLVTTVTVSPDFTISSASSSALICEGESVTINHSGASSYTLNPGNITANPATLAPNITTIYQVTGSNGSCTKNAAITVTVNPYFEYALSVPDTILCNGLTTTVTASGASNYTFQPGGLNGYTVALSPSVTTVYTVNAAGTNQCFRDTSFTIAVKECDFTGITEQSTQAEIRIYPSPAHESFQIESALPIQKIKVVSINGQVVYEAGAVASPVKIITKNWAAGIYFVQLYIDNSQTLTEKIIIE